MAYIDNACTWMYAVDIYVCTVYMVYTFMINYIHVYTDYMDKEMHAIYVIQITYNINYYNTDYTGMW